MCGEYLEETLSSGIVKTIDENIRKALFCDFLLPTSTILNTANVSVLDDPDLLNRTKTASKSQTIIDSGTTNAKLNSWS